jgi:hypothetical protein
MQSIFVYSESGGNELTEELRKAFEATVVSTPAELARSLVRHTRPRCLVVQVPSVNEELLDLLNSIAQCYPLLPICLVSARRLAGWPERFAYIQSGESPRGPAEEIRRLFSASTVRDRRQKDRFDWPLQGFLTLEGESRQKHALWALSSGGAFLESTSFPPSAGARGRLRVIFQNSSLTTDCEVLDMRQASSSLPSGFAVRFPSLNEASQRLIDRIVRDALLQRLLGGESEPEVPSLDEEDLTIPGIDTL